MRTFKHSGDMGDLIYSLPIIKHLGGAKCLYLNPNGLGRIKYDGSRSGLDLTMIKFIKPLLENQSYIKRVEIWKNQKCHLDIDEFRKKGIKYHQVNLCEAILSSFDIPFSTANEPWLQAKPNREAPVVFSRTPRYQNPEVSLRDYLVKYPDSIFVGLRDEWHTFAKKVGPIKYYRVNNALEMASVIAGADLFIGNQSFAMSLAIALGKEFIQEVCPRCENCVFPQRKGTYLRGN